MNRYNDQQAQSSKAERFDATFDSFVPTPNRDAQKRAEMNAGEVRHATIEAWMANLPEAVRPYRMVAKFERVVLVIIERWDNRSGVLAYIDEMLHDESAVRMWLAPEVVAEMMRLSSYLRASRFH